MHGPAFAVESKGPRRGESFRIRNFSSVVLSGARRPKALVLCTGNTNGACGVAFPATLFFLHADRGVLRRACALLRMTSLLWESILLSDLARVRRFVLIVGLLRYRRGDDEQRRDNPFFHVLHGTHTICEKREHCETEALALGKRKSCTKNHVPSPHARSS